MAKTIKDSNGAVKGELATLAAYFKLPGETLTQFGEQVKKLSAADKTELALGAAKNMGWTVEETA